MEEKEKLKMSRILSIKVQDEQRSVFYEREGIRIRDDNEGSLARFDVFSLKMVTERPTDQRILILTTYLIG